MIEPLVAGKIEIEFVCHIIVPNITDNKRTKPKLSVLGCFKLSKLPRKMEFSDNLYKVLVLLLAVR